MSELQNRESLLFTELATIIEQGKKQVTAQVNSTITFTYWHIGKRINEHVLNNKRAEYAKEIVPTLAAQLTELYGKSFEEKNLRRMMQFANLFSEHEIVVPVVRQLSWSHILKLLPLKSQNERLYYAKKATEEQWSKRQLQHQIERKAYERQEIATLQLTDELAEIHDTFKDPYFLDFLGLKDGYLEKDLESAIIKELESFILELGKGFTFVERQKRMIIDGEDFYLDLLFTIENCNDW